MDINFLNKILNTYSVSGFENQAGKLFIDYLKPFVDSTDTDPMGNCYAYIGNNCVIKNSIILNNVYIGDNTYIENCIVESRDTIRANSNYVGEPGKPMVVMERSERYTI